MAEVIKKIKVADRHLQDAITILYKDADMTYKGKDGRLYYDGRNNDVVRDLNNLRYQLGQLIETTKETAGIE